MDISDLLFEIAHITPDELVETIRKLQDLRYNPQVAVFKAKLKAVNSQSAATPPISSTSQGSDQNRQRRLSEDIAREMLDFLLFHGLPQRITTLFFSILEIDVRLRKSLMEQKIAASAQISREPGQVKIGQEEIRKAWIAQLPQDKNLFTPLLCARMSVLADVLRDYTLIIFNYILIDKTILAVANLENYLQEHYQNLNDIGVKAQILKQKLEATLQQPNKDLDSILDIKKSKLNQLTHSEHEKKSRVIEKELEELEEQLLKKRSDIKDLQRPFDMQIIDLEKPFNDERKTLLQLINDKRISTTTLDDTNNKNKKAEEKREPLPESPKSNSDSKKLTRKLSLTSIFTSKIEKKEGSPRSGANSPARSGTPTSSVPSTGRLSSASTNLSPLHLRESTPSPVDEPSFPSSSNPFSFRFKLSSPKGKASLLKSSEDSPPSKKP